MAGEARVHDLIGKVYEAALDHANWDSVVAEVADTVGASAALFYGPNLERGGVDFAIWSRLDPADFADYAEYYYQHDVWLQQGAKYPAKSVLTSQMIVPSEEFENSEFYQDFLRRSNIYHLLTAVPRQNDGDLAPFSLYRTPNEVEFGEDEYRVLEALTPHLQRALRLHRHVEELVRHRDASATGA